MPVKYKLISNWKEKIKPLSSIDLSKLEAKPYTIAEIKNITGTSICEKNIEILISKILKSVFMEVKILEKEKEIKTESGLQEEESQIEVTEIVEREEKILETESGLQEEEKKAMVRKSRKIR